MVNVVGKIINRIMCRQAAQPNAPYPKPEPVGEVITNIIGSAPLPVTRDYQAWREGRWRSPLYTFLCATQGKIQQVMNERFEWYRHQMDSTYDIYSYNANVKPLVGPIRCAEWVHEFFPIRTANEKAKAIAFRKEVEAYFFSAKGPIFKQVDEIKELGYERLRLLLTNDNRGQTEDRLLFCGKQAYRFALANLKINREPAKHSREIYGLDIRCSLSTGRPYDPRLYLFYEPALDGERSRWMVSINPHLIDLCVFGKIESSTMFNLKLALPPDVWRVPTIQERALKEGEWVA